MVTLSQRDGVLVEVFEDRASAQSAVRNLRNAGFGDSQLQVSHVDGELLEGPGPESKLTPRTLLGLGIGALCGVGMLSGIVPAMETNLMSPVMTAGTFGLLFSGAAAAVTAGGTNGTTGYPSTKGLDHSTGPAEVIVLTVRAGAREQVALSVLNQFRDRT
ncbi:hypothetical protein [Schlesneria sp. T3-172]|uniref:hypothetical protein n=1 Tax=Schlesneria sphaerica TaxID=3373610 RepID=UPI0037C72F3C